MTESLTLVIDAGSSSIRCHLTDSHARILRSTSRAWTYLNEPDAPYIGRAFHPEACRQSLQDAIRECADSTAREDASISAIAVTSQRQSLAFLDETGSPIYVGPNTDLRAVLGGLALDFQSTDMIRAITGNRPSLMTAPAKLMWFQENRPEAYGRIAHVMTLADWIAFELTGKLGCERTLASEAGLMDISRGDAGTPVFDQLNLRCPTPPFHEPDSVWGDLHAPGLGLPSPTPVVNAGADTQCGLIGMGITDNASAGIVAGWSATVQLLSSNADLPAEGESWLGHFQIPRLKTIENNAGDMGHSMRWLAHLLFSNADDPYQTLNEAAQSAEIGSEGVSAFLGPQPMDTLSPAMKLGGFTFPVPLSLGGPSAGMIARAALESFAYALRANLEEAERVAGFQADRVALGGGFTRMSTFNSIMCDVLDRQTELSSTPDASAIGASLVARTAIGEYTSLSHASAQTARANTRLSPDPQNASEYEHLYREWLELQYELGEMMT